MISDMRRWEPNARGRLEQAAIELYRDRGFEQTTVAEIAGRAGLTERTFFRYFADKREVLFSGASELQALIVRAVADAPAGASPLDAVRDALEGTGPLFEQRRDYARVRQSIIEANPDLQERELKKMATLARAIAGALRERGVSEPGASLTAEAGIAVFRVSFERWVADADLQPLSEVMRESFTELEAAITGARRSPAASSRP